MSPRISRRNDPENIPLAATTMPGAASRGMDEVLTKSDVAERVHVTVRTVENWQRRGVLPYLKIGKVVRFVWADVLDALKNFRVCRRTSKKQ